MKDAPTPAANAVPQLSRHAVYVAPSGRRCRVAYDDGVQKLTTKYATLVYHRADGRPGADSDEGFTLMPANFRILRAVG